MMKTMIRNIVVLPLTALALCASNARAQNIISALVTITNTPTAGNSITVNGTVRTWATNATSGTHIQISTNIGTCATNLFVSYSLWRQAGINPSISGGTAVRLTAGIGQALTVSITGAWASVTMSTQTFVSGTPVVVPFSSAYPETAKREAVASLLVGDLITWATNQIPPTAPLVQRLMSLDTAQVVTAPKTMTNLTLTGAFVSEVSNRIASGIATNISVFATQITAPTSSIGGLLVTNGAWVNGGFFPRSASGGLSVFGGASDSTSIAIGTGSASTNYGVALGRNTLAHDGTSSVAIGDSATAKSSGVAVGDNAKALGGSIAIGAYAQANYDSIAIGDSAAAETNSSIAIGFGSQATRENQIMLGTSSQHVVAPGALAIGATLRIGNEDATGGWPANWSTGVLMSDNTSPTSAPTNGASLFSLNGILRYRDSTGQGSGQNNHVHNAAAEVVGSGDSYSLTTSFAFVDFSGTDAEINTLPTGGTYLLIANISAYNTTSGDLLAFKLYNATAASDIANSQVNVSSVNGYARATITSIATLSNPARIQIYGRNSSAARGSVVSTDTKILYVRLF